MIALVITIVFVLAGAALLLFIAKSVIKDAFLLTLASVVVYAIAGFWVLYMLYEIVMSLPFVHGSGHVRLP